MGAVTDSDTGSVIAYTACKEGAQSTPSASLAGTVPTSPRRIARPARHGRKQVQVEYGRTDCARNFWDAPAGSFRLLALSALLPWLGFLIPRRAECLPARASTGTVTCAYHVMKHEPRRVPKLAKLRQLDRSCDVTFSLFVPCSRVSSPRDAFRPQSLSS